MTPPPPPPPPGPPRPPSAPPRPPILRVDSPMLKPEEAGDRIGRYKLLQQIGEGGFGVVWMAEQEKPVRRRVALKVIKLGMDTKQVIARFEAERQALAMMDHPNIAKVLDAGATQTGRPFFVMELVRGIRITDFCDQSKLSAADRLGLFVSVCHAVQHAHQKGIIHRDLKPSNILVTLHDGVPVPKVIDFGVAKATQARLTDLTLFTQFDQMIGTPLYMSPEQAEMSGLDVDTRTDIYSLGVLLYELLTGRTPFDATELTRRGIDEMRRAIRETDPPKPSTRFSTLAAEARATVAQQRQAEPAKLTGLLRGDLDWVVMKALEKDRTRRYETANGMAMDVQRFLSNEPVVARPPSTAYRLQKLVRRNKLAVVAAAAVALALIAAITAGVWQGMRAGREKKRATAAVANLRDTAPAFADQARALAARGQFDEAIDKLAFAARLRPDVADYVARQGDLRQSQLRLADAAEAYRAALKIAPEHPRAKANAALCARLLALKPNPAKPSLEVLAPLFATMQREQRAAGEQAPVAKLFAAERQRVLDEWLPRLASLPIPAGQSLAERVSIGEDGRLALDLTGSSIADLAALKGFPLGSLNLTSCASVTDLTALGDFALTELNLAGTGVSDLAPLAKMRSLAKLKLAGTKVVILTPLAGTRLRELDASGIPAPDYTPLAGLPLETFAGGPQLQDLSFLRQAPLRSLRISEGPLPRNLAALSEIKTLETLFLPPDCWKLPEGELAAFEKLRAHPALRELRIAAALGERAGLALPKEQFWREWDKSTALLRALRTAGLRFNADRLPNGTWSLDLSGQTLRDLAPLKGQPIGALTLHGTGVADLEPLRGMPLESLKLAGCPVADLTPLANAPLKLLWMDEAVTASDFSPLATLTALESVLLPPQATEIEALRKLPKLQRISYTAAQNGEPVCTAEDFWKHWAGLGWLLALRKSGVAIKEVRQLPDGTWELNLEDAGITELTILRGAPISTLYLQLTAVTDLSPLRGMALKRVNVGRTKVTDLTPLKGMPIDFLSLSGNTAIADLSALREMPLRELRVKDCYRITDLSPLTDSKTLRLVVLPPSAKNIEFLRTFPDLERISFQDDSKNGYRPDKTAAEFWKEYDQPWLRALRESGVAIKGVKSLPDGTWDLDLSEAKDFSDLTLLKGAPISRLNLSKTAIADLAPLRGMALAKLDLTQTKVTDLSPLQGMPIDNLLLAETAVTDLEPLRGMALKQLWLHGTKVTDLRPLEGMPLTYVNLAKTKVSDLSVLRGMPLTGAQFSRCEKITDVSPLAEAKGLTLLTLPPNAKNFEFLRDFPKLQRLSFAEDSKNDYRPDKTAAEFWKEHDQPWLRALRESGVAIKGVKSLPDGTWELDLSEAKDFSDLTLLKDAPISSLNIGKTSVSDLAPLRGLPLKTLTLDYTTVTDLTPLQGMPLEDLRVKSTKVADISALRGMPIKLLDLGGTAVADLAPLRGMAIQWLWLNNTKVADLRPLEGMPLTELNLNALPVTDLSPLRGMPLTNLRFLDCPALTDLSPLAEAREITLLTLPPNAKNIEFLRTFPKLERISFNDDSKNGNRPDRTAAEFWKEYDGPGGLPALRASGVAMNASKPLPAASSQPAPVANTTEALSRAGKFAEAARLSREKLDRAAKDDSSEWMTCAAVLLAAGDRDGYRSACAEAITRFKDTAKSDDAERIAKACLLAPDSGVDPAALAALVATAQKTNSHWIELVSALAEYRTGHWAAAADWAAKLSANPKCPERGTAAANAILAMAEHQRQRPSEARAALAAATKSVAANWPQGGEGVWYAWLIADLLTKEAAGLIK